MKKTMKRISVLDCTLRDGGYCNEWKFGLDNIKRVIKGLCTSNVEYIECGFLTNRVKYDKDKSKFTNLSQLSDIISDEKTDRCFLVMINYGEYAIEDLPNRSETCIDGIRVAFHKKDAKDAIDYCLEIKKKGYLVFVQPMVSMNYSAEEFVTLIHAVNQLKPYAFYIVDSFGMMKRKALMQLVEMVEMNLVNDIHLGFHAHNNLQLAYSNAQYLAELPINFSLIIDASVHGMGRGAGNLNSELFLDYLNENCHSSYLIRPLLKMMDEIISGFYDEKKWGYSLPNYLSATHLIHPNYAAYLDDKKTLTLEAMDEIFDLIDPEKGCEYDAKYIERLYIDYLSRREHEDLSINVLSKALQGKKVLLIAPGRNAVKQKERILRFANREHPVIISVNYDYPYLKTDYIFVSNMRRFSQLSENVYDKTIITSNIKSMETYACVDYYRLINTVDGVIDNAGLMAIEFIMQRGITECYLAGFDGYSRDVYKNFESRDMALVSSAELLEKINNGMRQVIKSFTKEIRLSFITDTKYDVK